MALTPSVLPTVEVDEGRFGRGAWLTLALALLVFVWPLSTVVFGHDVPADGWSHTSDPSALYRLDLNLTNQPSPLREGDIITAINGHPLIFGHRSPLPPDLQVGLTLRYTITRDGQPLEVEAPLVPHSSLSMATYLVRATQRDVALTLVPLLTLLIVGFAFVRRPGSPAARLLLLIFSYYASSILFLFTNWDPLVYAFPIPLAFAHLFRFNGWSWLFFPALIHLVLVFPVRLWPMRRFPHLALGVLYGVPSVLILLGVSLAMAGQEAAGVVLGGMNLVLVAVFVVTFISSLVHNLRTVREPVARAQLRWILVGLAGWGVGLVFYLLSAVAPVFLVLVSATFGWLTALLPLALVIAITRYRLFDIDIIINRALVYGSLTGLLLAVYLGSVVLLQASFRALTGQSSELAIIVSTLAIAALFQPLRGRIQRLVDRRFYRERYDATRTLAIFSTHLRDEVDLPTLRNELVGVVQETMQPASVSLWIRPSSSTPRSTAQGADQE